MRSKPFKEWNIVYFDPTRTDSDRILKRLRAQGCKNATFVKPTGPEAKGTSPTLRVLNPVITPGDCVQVALGGDAQVVAVEPAKWASHRIAGKGTDRSLLVQTPKDASQKKHELRITLLAGGERRTVTLPVEIVRRIP